MTKVTISIAHSPDADDRFMFWPLKAGLVGDAAFSFTFHEADTQSLNELALAGNHDIVAVSAAHYPSIAERYQPLRMGASVGAGYGPVVVTLGPTPTALHDNGPQSNLLLLSPGLQTTAHNTLLALGYRFAQVEVVPITPMELVFERLRERSRALLTTQSRPQLAHERPPKSGGAESGARPGGVVALLIHEGRLLYESQGARLLLDLGKAWHKKFGAHLPLGINVIRRSLPLETRIKLSALLRASCAFAQQHRGEFAKQAALNGPLAAEEVEHYLDLYANETTTDISDSDRLAFDHLIKTIGENSAPGHNTGARAVDSVDWV